MPSTSTDTSRSGQELVGNGSAPATETARSDKAGNDADVAAASSDPSRSDIEVTGPSSNTAWEAGATTEDAGAPVSAPTGAAEPDTADAASDDVLLRGVLKRATEQADREPGKVASVNASLAMVLYDRGNREAAKELLCDDHRYYNVFRTSAAPCRVRTQWSAEEEAEVPMSPAAAIDKAPVP
jgi:hypothetical protein